MLAFSFLFSFLLYQTKKTSEDKQTQLKFIKDIHAIGKNKLFHLNREREKVYGVG